MSNQSSVVESKEATSTVPAKQEAEKAVVAKEAPPLETENHVDPEVASTFVAMGYSLPLPEHLIGIYNATKLRKDRVHPGKLSIEGFALVATMAEIYERVTKKT